MTRKITDLPLIKIQQSENSELFDKLITPNKFHRLICSNMEKVLQVMLDNFLTLVPDRRAVYFYYDWFMIASNRVTAYHSAREKIGESFPNEKFRDNCYQYCKEKPKRRQGHPKHLTSHESRNPALNKWGGSITISFLMIPIEGEPFVIQVEGAPSGLKEWEDAVLFLGTLYRAGLIKFEDEQVQEILRRIDKSLENELDFRPEGITVGEYAHQVFEYIDLNHE